MLSRPFGDLLAAIARQIACEASMCRGSVVRMNSSLLTFISAVISRKFCETRSQKVCGSRPAARADLSTFWPCSSVPVRNLTRRPSSRMKRASASQATVV